MASFMYKGLDELELSLQEIAEIPEDVRKEMLTAAGEVVVQAQKEQLKSMGLYDTGKLAESIRMFYKYAKNVKGRFGRVLVYPYGKHGKRNRKLVTKAYKRSKHGRTYTVGGDTVDVTNNEVGFIHEFGAPRRNIPPSQWMRKANEKSSERSLAAMFAVYDRWLQSKNL